MDRCLRRVRSIDAASLSESDSDGARRTGTIDIERDLARDCDLAIEARTYKGVAVRNTIGVLTSSIGAVTWRDLRIAAGAVLACVSGDGRVGVVCTSRGGIGGGSINPEPGEEDLRAPFCNFSAGAE